MKSENKQQRTVALRLDDAALSKCVGGATLYVQSSSLSQVTIAPVEKVSVGSLIGSIAMPF